MISQNLNAQIASTIVLIGKIMIASLFIWDAAFQLIPDFNNVVIYIEQNGLPWPRYVAAATAVFLLLAPLFIFFDKTETVALLGLSAFCLLTALIFHQYWTYDNPDRTVEQIQFMKDFALSGGLLALSGRRYQSSRRDVSKSAP